MSIKVTCSSCSSNYNLNDSLEWKKVKCPKCQNIIEVKSEWINSELNQGTKPKSKKNNKTLILVSAIIFILISWTWFAYKSWIFDNIISPEAEVTEELESAPVEEVPQEVNSDVNYKIDFSWNISEVKSWEVKNSWSLDLKDMQVFSENSWLNQKISIWNLDIALNGENTYSLKNLDLVSDNEKVYLSNKCVNSLDFG